MEAMSTVGNARLAEVVPDVLSALHEVLERHQVTEHEWMAALAFLTEVGRADEFVLLSDVTRTSVLIDMLSHAGEESGATASDVEGPLYVEDPPVREGRPAKIYEEYEGMGDGEVLIVSGRVTSAGGGDPLPEAVVEHPWRPAHIHFKVTAPGHRTLVTQVFFPDDPYLENDTIGAVKPALVRPVERRGDHLGCDFDIALAPAG